MTRKDEFDDHEGFQSAFGKIADAMEQSRETLRQRGPLLSVMTAIVALIVLLAVFWASYPRGDGDLQSGPVPMIRADMTPFKTAPDDPGGMEIPYRDSTVFETLRGGQNTQGEESRIESLLPPPEEPVIREQVFAGFKTEKLDLPLDTAESLTEAEQQEPANDPAPVAATPAVPAVEEKPAPQKPAEKPAEKKEPEKKEIAKKEVAKTPEAKAATTATIAGGAGTHYVQLGSVKNRQAAEDEWGRLKKEFSAQLGTLTMRIQDVTLPGRGTFYRIQGGAVSQEKAREICAAITARKAGGCIVVAR